MTATLLFVMSLCITFNAECGTIYVDDDNPGGAAGTLADPVPTITEAIGLAVSNDTIRVFAGTYNETVTVNDVTFGGARISIVGNGSADTFIGPDNGEGFRLRGVRFRLEGFAVEAASNALNCIGASPNVTDLAVRNAGTAIRLEDCRDSTFSDVVVRGSDAFAYIEDCRRGSLTDGSFTFNDTDVHIGISLIDSWGFTLAELDISAMQAPGLTIVGNYDHSIETSVEVNGEAIHYFNDIHGTVSSPIAISGLNLTMDSISSIGKVTIVNSSRVIVSGNDLANPPYGSCVLLVNCENVAVGNNSINRGIRETSGDSGVKTIDCDKVTIRDITLRRAFAGVNLIGTTGSELYNVSALKCAWGLRVEEGGGNLVNASAFGDNAMGGIALVDTSGNLVDDTFMNANGFYGYYIEGDYDNNLTRDCTVDTEPVHYYNGLHGSEAGITISGLVLNRHSVSNVGKVSLVNCYNVTLEGCNLRNNDRGFSLFLYGSNHLTVRENTMAGSLRGLVLIDVNASTFRKNTIDSTEHALHIEGRYDNWIHRSNEANGEEVHYLYGNVTASVTGLVLTRPRVSNVGKVTLVDVGNATVEGCTLENGTAGVMLVSGSAVVSSCLLKNNEAGTRALSGVLVVEDCDVIANEEGLTSGGSLIARDNRVSENGIGILGSGGSRVRKNEVSDSGTGIVLEGEENIVSDNLVVRSTFSGIEVDGNNAVVRSNTCGSNRYGIFVRGGENVSVVGNAVRRNDYYGIRIRGEPFNLTMTENQVFGNGFRNPSLMGAGMLIVDAANLTVEGNDVWWNQDSDVAIEHCENVTVRDCSMNGTETGVWTYRSLRVSVEDCNFEDAAFGVDTYETNNVSVLGNAMTDISQHGILIRYSNGGTVEHNDVEAVRNGVLLMGSMRVSVGNNTLDARFGINLTVASQNSIWHNDLAADTGVFVRGGSVGNVIGRMDLTGLKAAVSVDGANGTIVRDCTFDSNDNALVMTEAWQGIVLRCTFSDSDVGIELVETDMAVIEDCVFSGLDRAIHARQSDRNEIRGAEVEDVDEFLRSYEGFMNAFLDTDLSDVSLAAHLSGGSEAKFVNISYTDDQLSIHDSSVLFVMNYLKVRVLYLDLAPLEGAGVRITEKDITRYRSFGYNGLDEDTNKKGETPWVQVAYATYRVASKKYPRVFANATMLSWEEEREVDMATTHVEVFVTNVTAPVLEWTGESGYVDSGVYPAIGNATQQFEFRVHYSDGSGDPPLGGNPWVMIDVNGDGAYNMTFQTTAGPFAEGRHVLSKVGTSNDYVTGMVYRFLTVLPVSDGITYMFGAKDSNGLPAHGNEPIETHHDPLVIDGDLDIARVTVDGLDVVLFARLLVDNGSDVRYVVPEEDGIRVREGDRQSTALDVPSERAISLVMDWSSNVPSGVRETVLEWMWPFLDGLTGADVVEVAKYGSEVWWLSGPTNDADVTAEAVNESVASGTEAHMYDAIADADGSGGRHHVIVVAFGPDYALHPGEHVSFDDLVSGIDGATSVHIVAADVEDDDELADLASATGGTFQNVGMDDLPGAILLALRAAQGEFAITYAPGLVFNGTERWGNLSVRFSAIDVTEAFSYVAPRTPAPSLNMTYPGGWRSNATLPVDLQISGDLYTLAVQYRWATLDNGAIGNWSDWTNTSLADGALNMSLTPGAYEVRAQGWSISGDTHGWVGEFNGNVSLFDPTPPAFEGATSPSTTGNALQMRFWVGNASEPEAGIAGLHVVVRRNAEVYNGTITWNGSAFALVLHGAYLPGVHTWSITVVSGSGMTAGSTGTVLVDPSLPSTLLLAPTEWTGLSEVALQANTTGNASDLRIEVAVFDRNGTIDLDNATWTVLATGNEWTGGILALEADLLTEDMVRYVVKAGAVNPNTGLGGPWNVSDPFTADLLPPVVTAAELAGGREALVLSFEAYDEGSGPAAFTYSILRGETTVMTGSGATSGNSTVVLEGLWAEGTYVAQVSVADALGHVSEPSTTGSITVSDGPPSVPVLTFPADGAILEEPPTLAWNASVDPEGDPVTYILVVDGPDGRVVSETVTQRTYDLTGIAYGTYAWSVRSSDGTYESSPANSTFHVSRPDLTGSFIFYTNGSVTSIEAPGTVSIVVRVFNVGLLPAGEFDVTLTFEGAVVRRTHFDGLAPGGSDSVTYSIELDLGVHEFRLDVDTDGAVAEADEDNNDFTLTITVGEAPDTGEGGGGIDIGIALAALLALAMIGGAVAILFFRTRGGARAGRSSGKGRGAATGRPGATGRAGKGGRSAAGGKAGAGKGTIGSKVMDPSEYERMRREFSRKEGDQRVEWERPKR